MGDIRFLIFLSLSTHLYLVYESIHVTIDHGVIFTLDSVIISIIDMLLAITRFIT